MIRADAASADPGGLAGAAGRDPGQGHRTRDEIAALFDGFTLVEPGLVWLPEWRPGSPADMPENPEQFWALVGVAKRDA